MSGVKEGRLIARWSKRHNDFLINFPSKPDGHFLYGLISSGRYEVLSTGRTLLEELESRGYDTKTLRIQCDRKAKP